MKRFAILTIVVISILASWWSEAGNKPKFFVAFSLETVNMGITFDLAVTTSFESCFKLNRFHWSAADDFARGFGFVADVSEGFDNRTNCFGTISCEITFPSFHNFSWKPASSVLVTQVDREASIGICARYSGYVFFTSPV